MRAAATHSGGDVRAEFIHCTRNPNFADRVRHWCQRQPPPHVWHSRTSRRRQTHENVSCGSHAVARPHPRLLVVVAQRCAARAQPCAPRALRSIRAASACRACWHGVACQCCVTRCAARMRAVSAAWCHVSTHACARLRATVTVRLHLPHHVVPRLSAFACRAAHAERTRSPAQLREAMLAKSPPLSAPRGRQLRWPLRARRARLRPRPTVCASATCPPRHQTRIWCAGGDTPGLRHLAQAIHAGGSALTPLWYRRAHTDARSFDGVVPTRSFDGGSSERGPKVF